MTFRMRYIWLVGIPASAIASACSAPEPPTDSTTGGSAGRVSSGGKGGVGGAAGVSGSSGKGGASGAGAAAGSAGSGGRMATGGSSGTPGAGTAGAAASGGLGAAAGSGGSAGAGVSGGSAAGSGGMGGSLAGSGGAAGGTAGAAAAGAAGAGAGAAGTGGGDGKSAGCGKAPTIPSNMYNNGQHISITAASIQRRYILSVPTNYDNTHPYKLVIAYHQLNGNDDQMYSNKYYHLLPLAKDTAIFVAPNGQKNGGNCADASNCGWPNTNNSDIALADAVVKELEDNFCIDTNRIFATGWSYGGSMSYKTACERPLGGVANGFVRAIAVYSGAQLSGNCTPTKPVAYFAAHGTHDSVLNYSQGVGLAQNFAKANGCTWATPTEVQSGAHVCTNEMGCATGYPVEFCSFNGDHTPDPDNGQSGNSWVYQPVWDFFSQF